MIGRAGASASDRAVSHARRRDRLLRNVSQLANLSKPQFLHCWEDVRTWIAGQLWIRELINAKCSYHNDSDKMVIFTNDWMMPIRVMWRRRLVRPSALNPNPEYLLLHQRYIGIPFKQKANQVYEGCQLRLLDLCAVCYHSKHSKESSPANGPFVAGEAKQSPKPGLVPSFLPCSSLSVVISFSWFELTLLSWTAFAYHLTFYFPCSKL